VATFPTRSDRPPPVQSLRQTDIARCADRGKHRRAMVGFFCVRFVNSCALVTAIVLFAFLLTTLFSKRKSIMPCCCPERKHSNTERKSVLVRSTCNFVNVSVSESPMSDGEALVADVRVHFAGLALHLWAGG
jgi:hypothetical protein